MWAGTAVAESVLRQPPLPLPPSRSTRPEPVSEINVAQASSNSWTCSAHSTLRHGSRRVRRINDCRVELIGLTDVGQKLLALDEHWAESRLAVRVDPRASTTMSSCLKAATGLCSAWSDDHARQGWGAVGRVGRSGPRIDAIVDRGTARRALQRSDLRFWSPRSDSNRRPSDYESVPNLPTGPAQNHPGCSGTGPISSDAVPYCLVSAPGLPKGLPPRPALAAACLPWLVP
jgi:hypothetical protein